MGYLKSSLYLRVYSIPCFLFPYMHRHELGGLLLLRCLTFWHRIIIWGFLCSLWNYYLVPDFHLNAMLNLLLASWGLTLLFSKLWHHVMMFHYSNPPLYGLWKCGLLLVPHFFDSATPLLGFFVWSLFYIHEGFCVRSLLQLMSFGMGIFYAHAYEFMAYCWFSMGRKQASLFICFPFGGHYYIDSMIDSTYSNSIFSFGRIMLNSMQWLHYFEALLLTTFDVESSGR